MRTIAIVVFTILLAATVFSEPESLENRLKTVVAETESNPEQMFSWPPSYEILLRTGSFIPTERQRDKPLEESLQPDQWDDIYFLVQFDKDEASFREYSQMAEDGIVFLEYMNHMVSIARIPGELLEKNYPSVRWIGVLEPSQKINPELQAYYQPLQSDDRIRLTLLFYEPLEQDEISSLLRLGELGQTIFPTKAVTLETSRSSIADIAELSFVQWIDVVPEHRVLLDTSAKVIDASSVWSYGNDGAGITIGVLDTGIRKTHQHFTGRTIFGAKDWADNDTDPEAVCGDLAPNMVADCSNQLDDDGDRKIDEGTHGVHVAGIISGQGTVSGRALRGIADRATLVIERIFDENNVGVGPGAALNDIWVEILDPDHNNIFDEPNSADVISNSWGAYEDSNQVRIDGDYDASSQKVDEVVTGSLSNGKEIPIAFAAGNKGVNGFSVSVPGTAKNTLTVGASADFRTEFNGCPWCYNQNNLHLMEFTSRGTDDGRIKPDLLAPGAFITSAVLENAYGGYYFWAGTSMATPHVASVAAQILKQYPSFPYADFVKVAILGSTVGGGTTDRKSLNQGWGRLNAFEAIYSPNDEYLTSLSRETVGYLLSGFPGERVYPLFVPSGTDRLDATMVYTDVPGVASITKSLIHDLDLYVVKPDGTRLFEDDDDVNNVEKYIIDNPEEGQWSVRVKAVWLGLNPFQSQNFALQTRIIKKTQPIETQVEGIANKSTLLSGESFSFTGKISAVGLSQYELEAEIQVPENLSLVYRSFDGSDATRDVVGDIRVGDSKSTRAWTIKTNQTGSYPVVLVVKGMTKTGQPINVSATTIINVVSSCTVPVEGIKITENTIFCPGVYTLQNGTQIIAPNVTLDCNGATITGLYTSMSTWQNGTTILSNASGIAIKNCIIKDYYTGISAASSFAQIEHNRIENNTYGIMIVARTDGVRVFNNTITRTNMSAVYMSGGKGTSIEENNISNNYAGITIAHAREITLARNIIRENSDYYGVVSLTNLTNVQIVNNVIENNREGIYATRVGNSRFEGNNLSNNYEGEGIYLSYSSNNTLTNNTANSNNGDGIHVYYSSNNTLTSNRVNANPRYGIYLVSSSNNTLTHNTANSNDYAGIYLYYSSNNTLTSNGVNDTRSSGIFLLRSSNNILTNNTASSNNGDGIHVSYTSSNNILTNNTANSNNYGGIHVSYTSSNNILTNNTANSNNYTGIFISSSSSNTLTHNTASSNNGDGIYLLSSSNNTLTNNTASSNNGDGIHVYYYSNNILTNNNTASSNYYAGIYLVSSSNNTITFNTVNANLRYGIYLDYSSNNTLTHNTASSNNSTGIYLSYTSSNNLVYNNFFNRNIIKNARDSNFNFWNTTKDCSQPNIIGGPCIGGNFWSDYGGKDTNLDGFGDTMLPYNSNGWIVHGGDYLPLVRLPSSKAPCQVPAAC